MGKLSPEDRQMVLDFINELFLLDQTGWDQSELLRECGRMLGDSDEPKYMKTGVSVKDYQNALKEARMNEIPIEVFKQRLRRGMSPKKAATTEYNPRKRGWKRTK